MTWFVHAAIEKRYIYSLSLFRMETFTKKKLKCIGERREGERKRKGKRKRKGP